MSYRQDREELFQQIRQEGIFTWDFMYEQEYALAAVCQLPHSDLEEIRCATERLGEIFAKTITILQQSSIPLLSELGIPTKAMEAVRVPVIPHWPTTIGRFDFARTPSGLKMIEFNSDTPGGIVEAYYLNRKVCEYFGYTDVNAELIKHFPSAFGEIIAQYKALGYATEHIVFSSLDWHEEDAGTARFLMNHSGLKASFAPLKNLRIYQDRLWHLADGQLQPIDVLYRLHPLGILSEETDIDGYPTGEHLLQLTANKKLAIINQPGALLAQSKATQALIWLLHENGEYFTTKEHRTIAAYMLPTYLENRFKERKRYVVKPVLGREGGAITIVDSDGTILSKDTGESYWEQSMVYQEYAELEQLTVNTLAGSYTGSLIWGSFLIGGRASAVNARLGGKITNDLSYFVPIRLDQA